MIRDLLEDVEALRTLQIGQEPLADFMGSCRSHLMSLTAMDGGDLPCNKFILFWSSIVHYKDIKALKYLKLFGRCIAVVLKIS